MHALELREISKRFSSQVEVLSSISLAIEPGERIAVVGESGSGKTTLLRVIAGLEQATTGRIRSGDKDITNWPPNKRNIGIVFQDYATYPRLSVAENLTIGLVGGGMSKAEKDSRLREIATWLGLEHLLTRLPAALSGGELQRVALGKALMTRPQLLLLDEPFSQLDVRLAEQMRRLLEESHRKFGSTQIIVTHHPFDALCSFDKLAVLDHGRLVQFDAPAEVRRNPQTLFAAELTSPCGLNVVDNQALNLPSNGKTRVAFRPEAVQVGLTPGDANGNDYAFRCRLGKVFDLGIVRLREAFVGEHRISFVSPSGCARQIGEETECYINKRDIFSF